MNPFGSGSPSLNNCARVRERMPSAPINTVPSKMRPSSVVTRTPSPWSWKLRDHGVGLERDQRIAAAGVEQHVMQVDAVDDDVGILEAGAERRPGRDPRDLVAGQRIEHEHGGRRVGLFEHRCAHADADRAHERRWGRTGCRSRWRRTRRAFEHAHRQAVARERKRGREPAEPAADDQDGFVCSWQWLSRLAASHSAVIIRESG